MAGRNLIPTSRQAAPVVPVSSSWVDRVARAVAPVWHLKRVRARIASDLVQRHYEAASSGRRTQNWNRSSADANAVNAGTALNKLREITRDLVRNNPYAESAIATIVDHTVGWGILPKLSGLPTEVAARWRAWAESTACDADGRHNLAGLEGLVLRTVAESGEALVRRRIRRLSDGLPIPLQIQVIEPDHLDTSKSGNVGQGGNMVVQGVEFDALGRRVAYWLFTEHPGASLATSSSTLYSESKRIPASEIRHVYKAKRPGQVRGVPWPGPVILRLKDLDEYEDATLIKQKVAALLAVITTDPDGSAPGLGVVDDTTNPGIDSLEPGAIVNVPAGRAVDVVQPPSVGEYGKFMSTNLHAIAAGLHVTYEDMTGDFSQVNFSSARLARLKHYARVHDWRWNMLIPQFCDPVWAWAMEPLIILGLLEAVPATTWAAPPMAMIEPDKEGLAFQRNVRSGATSWPDAVRELGYDPDELLREIAKSNEEFDRLGIVLDSDPRRTTQAGQLQTPTTTAPAAKGAD